MDKSEYVNLLITNITNLCAKKNISPNQLGIKSGTGKDIVANLQKGSIISSDKLAKIADYLGCSVDYLGRTDKPEGIETAPAPTGDSLSDEMLTRFNSLDFADKAQVISLIAELSKKKT